MTNLVRWVGIGRSPEEALAIEFKKSMAKVYLATEEWVRIINEEVIRSTPLDTGALRDSHYTVSKMRLNGFRIETGFKVSYAPIVHEWVTGWMNTGKPVNWTTPGTGEKYLERPFFSNAYNLPKFIKRVVRI